MILVHNPFDPTLDCRDCDCRDWAAKDVTREPIEHFRDMVPWLGRSLCGNLGHAVCYLLLVPGES